ncbi:D-glucuronyl C5-epimerase family protein [Senegalimassilia anaerobia]
MMGQIAQKMTMLKRWGKMLTGKTAVAVEQGLGRAYETGRLSGYYNDLTGKVTESTLHDEGGVPVSVIAGGARVHFPIAIFQYGLGCYDLAILKKGEAKHFLSSLRVCSEWALGAQREDGSWDAFGPIGSERYTVSSMAQGEGCSMLLRAHAAFGDERYRAAALKAAEFMLVDVDDGGVSSHDEGELFLEEYPQRPRRSVMNGWVFSLFGLYDASLADSRFAVPFEQSAETLARHLDDYDAGYWSYYDLEHRIASPAYHHLHIAQLRAMADLSGDARFSAKAEAYERYQESPANCRKAIARKALQKLTEKSDAVIVQ